MDTAREKSALTMASKLSAMPRMDVDDHEWQTASSPTPENAWTGAGELQRKNTTPSGVRMASAVRVVVIRQLGLLPLRRKQDEHRQSTRPKAIFSCKV